MHLFWGLDLSVAFGLVLSTIPWVQSANIALANTGSVVLQIRRLYETKHPVRDAPQPRDLLQDAVLNSSVCSNLKEKSEMRLLTNVDLLSLFTYSTICMSLGVLTVASASEFSVGQDALRPSPAWNGR